MSHQGSGRRVLIAVSPGRANPPGRNLVGDLHEAQSCEELYVLLREEIERPQAELMGSGKQGLEQGVATVVVRFRRTARWRPDETVKTDNLERDRADYRAVFECHQDVRERNLRREWPKTCGLQKRCNSSEIVACGSPDPHFYRLVPPNGSGFGSGVRRPAKAPRFPCQRLPRND